MIQESVDLLLTTGKVEAVTAGALAAARKIAKAANYLRTWQNIKYMQLSQTIPLCQPCTCQSSVESLPK